MFYKWLLIQQKMSMCRTPSSLHVPSNMLTKKIQSKLDWMNKIQEIMGNMVSNARVKNNGKPGLYRI